MLYYTYAQKQINTELENEVITIFNNNKKVYGTRKIKEKLAKQVSRRKIATIMEKYSLVSKYTKKIFKAKKSKVIEEPIPNIVDRKFDNRQPLEVAVSDLTYVRVKNKWCYLCSIIDLNNREIIGYSSHSKKDASIVEKAFCSIKADLREMQIFHTDRGTEFKNQNIDEFLKAFNIKRSLSAKGTPYDNAVSEATYHIIKTEFVFEEKFDSLEELELKFADYVNWYNNKRIHGSLGYMTPVGYRNSMIYDANLDKK